MQLIVFVLCFFQKNDYSSKIALTLLLNSWCFTQILGTYGCSKIVVGGRKGGKKASLWELIIRDSDRRSNKSYNLGKKSGGKT